MCFKASHTRQMASTEASNGILRAIYFTVITCKSFPFPSHSHSLFKQCSCNDPITLSVKRSGKTQAETQYENVMTPATACGVFCAISEAEIFDLQILCHLRQKYLTYVTFIDRCSIFWADWTIRTEKEKARFSRQI